MSRTDGNKEDGYYIVNFTSDPYTLQEDVSLDGIIIAIVAQAFNACYLSHLRQGWKWYAKPLDSKTHPVVGEKRTAVHPQLYVDIANDLLYSE